MPQKGVSKCFYNYIFRLFVTAVNELGQGYVLTRVCDSVHGGGWGGGMSACIAGGIPACLAAGLRGGVVSQHALQVSRPTLKGEVEGSGQGGSPGPHPRGKSPGGISTPGGVSPGPHLGGLLCGQWGVYSRGSLLSGVWRPPCDSYCCGRYASYWNAFLYKLCEIKGIRFSEVTLIPT